MKISTKKCMIGYGIVLAVSFIVLISRMCLVHSSAYSATLLEKQAHFVATRPLNANHRLTDKDFEIPPDIPGALAIYLPNRKEFIGAYLKGDVPKDSPIKRDMLLMQPSLTNVDAEHVLRLVPLTEQTFTLEWLDSGIDVQLYIGTKKPRASVVAIPCSLPDDLKSCSALISVQCKDIAPDEDNPTKWKIGPPLPRLDPTTSTDPKRQLPSPKDNT